MNLFIITEVTDNYEVITTLVKAKDTKSIKTWMSNPKRENKYNFKIEPFPIELKSLMTVLAMLDLLF